MTLNDRSEPGLSGDAATQTDDHRDARRVMEALKLRALQIRFPPQQRPFDLQEDILDEMWGLVNFNKTSGYRS